MHKIEYEWVANLLRHAGIEWSGVQGIDAAGVKQTINALIDLANKNMDPNGVTAESGGLLVKVYPSGETRVYVVLGEHNAEG